MDRKILWQHAQFHGAKRLIEPRHRFYWSIALLFLLWCALSNLLMTVQRFLQSPTSLVSENTVSTRMPFPSVLVCPEVFFPRHRIENLLGHAKYPKGMTADTIRPIIQQLTAFFSPDAPYTVDDLSQILEFLEYNGLDVEEAGELLTTSCNETLIKCRFHWRDFDCSDIFHVELTVYGYCCVFNGRSLKRDLREHKSPETKLRDWFTTDVGPFASLMVAVNQNQTLDNVDLTYKWLVLQNSRRYVDTTKNGTPLSPGAETWSSFHTSYLQVTDESRFLGDSLLGCGMKSKRLKHFPVYNRKYCLLECRMEITIRRCKCLLPVHLRPRGVPLCRATGLPCARRALEEFDRNSCDCPFTCEYRSTIIDTTTIKFSSNARPFDSFYDGLNLSQVTVVRVFLRSHQTTTYIRRPYFNFYDLFSQLGGAFNIFFGCSILSILELLQLAWHSIQLKRRTQTLKSEKKEKKTFLFGACCRIKKGRVGKKVFRRKVAFLNTRLTKAQEVNGFKMKMLSNLQGLK